MLSLLLTLCLPTADAADSAPAWAVGPVIDTIALPGRFPGKFSKEADAAGAFEPLRGDFSFGVRGVARPTDKDRFGARARYGFGSEGYRNATITLEYERYLVDASGMYVVAGGGIGAGTQRFLSATDYKLGMTTYLFRAQTGVGYSGGGKGGELSAGFTLPVPGIQTLTGPAGGESQVKGGFYGQFTIELTAFFGPLGD